MNLPIYAKKAQIVEAVLANQVVFIQGETGSGKTT
jgi:HrpA-like RNA helicase